MSMNHIRLYDLFRRELHLPDDKAADAVYEVQEIAEFAMASKKEQLATKEDLSALKTEINANVSSEIKSVRKDIQDFKDNIYRAIYLSGIVQLAAMIGIFLAIIKLIK